MVVEALGHLLIRRVLFAVGVRAWGTLVGVPIYVGILVDLEGLAVSFVLRGWKSDVPSVVHAWRLRQVRGGIAD